MKDLQNLLTQVSITNKKNDELLDSVGGRFNMFRILGVDHYEITHSSILSELLSPQGSHGLKYKFLHSFIDIVGLNEFIKDFDYHDATVETEVSVGNGRIDILINDNKGHALIIENKIYASDQWEQLKRYNEFAINKYGVANYKIFYLTLSGKEASINSGQNIDYKPISYDNDIILWLDQCVDLSSRFPLVRETINQYINHLKKLTNQDMDTKNKEDIVKILSSSKENVQAAFTIFENVGALKELIISNYLNPQLHEIAKELEIEVSSELKGMARYSGFSFSIPTWKYFKIDFEFEGNYLMQLGYMYTLKDSNEKPLETNSTLRQKFRHQNSNTKIPYGWSDMSRFSSWNNETFLSVLSGEVKNEIKRVVADLIVQAKDLEM